MLTWHIATSCMQGVEEAMQAARAAYEQQGAADKLRLFVDPGVGHECTNAMWDQVGCYCCCYCRCQICHGSVCLLSGAGFAVPLWLLWRQLSAFQ